MDEVYGLGEARQLSLHLNSAVGLTVGKAVRPYRLCMDTQMNTQNLVQFKIVGDERYTCPECGGQDMGMEITVRQLLLYKAFTDGEDVSLDDLVHPGEGNTVVCDICDYDEWRFEDLFL